MHFRPVLWVHEAHEYLSYPKKAAQVQMSYLFSRLLISLIASKWWSGHSLMFAFIHLCNQDFLRFLSNSLDQFPYHHLPQTMTPCILVPTTRNLNVKRYMCIQWLTNRSMIEKFVNTNSKMICIFHQSCTSLQKIFFRCIVNNNC